MTHNQKEIFDFIRSKGGEAVFSDIVAEFGSNYFLHAEKYVGQSLSRMVKAGILVRVKKGVYALGNGKKPATKKPDDGTLKLF